jgi:hypothetical protein
MPADGATCLTTRCFCELVRAEGIAQPANAWSSLAFVVAGVAALVLLRPATRPERVLLPLLAVALAAVGVGSFAFHATLTLWGQFVDVLLGADRAAADDALAELEEWAGVPYTPHSVFYRGDAAGLTTLLREISGSAGLDGVVLRPLALASGVQKIVTTVLPAFNPRPTLAPTLRERLGFELPVNQFA